MTSELTEIQKDERLAMTGDRAVVLRVVSELRRLREQLEADARALKAVRVLDAWAGECRGYYRVRGNWEASLHAVRGVPSDPSVGCQLMSEEGHEGRTFLGATADAARIAAAEALLAEDPSLGEGL
jgi:hypothetical protein